MIMYMGKPEDYTEEKIKERIKKEPNYIENYIILSECYQKNGKGIKDVFEPIEYVETNFTNGKYQEEIWTRKIDIYCGYGDINFNKGQYEQALEKYYIAWKLAKECIEEEKMKNILDYDLETISEYSLSDLIYNMNLIYEKLGKEYKEEKEKFKREVWNLLKLEIK